MMVDSMGPTGEHATDQDLVTVIPPSVDQQPIPQNQDLGPKL